MPTILKNVLKKVWPGVIGAVTTMAAVVLVAPAVHAAPSFQGEFHAEGRTEDADSHATVSISLDGEQLEKFKAETQQHMNEAKERAEKARTEAEQHRAEVKARAQSHMTEAKQRMCERRETMISNILGRISTRGDRHIAVINRISERTQAYYKVQNLAVANYDTLVANIATAKATAESAAAAVHDAKPDFGCSTGDPKGSSESFSQLVQARADAVKAYRDAVKALVAAVKAAAEKTSAAQAGTGSAALLYGLTSEGVRA